MTRGIYKITISGKIYIGSSVNIELRLKQHLWELKTGNHHNKQMLKLYLSSSDFHWEVLETCNTEELQMKESFWINYHDSHRNGLNMTDDTSRKLPITVNMLKFKSINKYNNVMYSGRFLYDKNLSYRCGQLYRLCVASLHIPFGFSFSAVDMKTLKPVSFSSDSTEGVMLADLVEPTRRELELLQFRG